MGETVSKQASPLPDCDRLPGASNDIDAASNHTPTVAESMNFSIIDSAEAVPADIKSAVAPSVDDKMVEEQKEEEEEKEHEEHEEITDDNVEAVAAEIEQLVNFVTQDVNKTHDEEGVRKVERLVVLLDSMKLFETSKSGDLARLSDKNNNSVSQINRLDGADETLLHKACIQGRADQVDILLSHPLYADDIDLNPVDSYGKTPFFWAHVNSHTECIRRLLQHPRLDVNLPTVLGDPLFFYSACRGQLDIIKCWLMSGRDLGLTANGKSLEDVIQVASNQGHTEIVELLISFQSAPVTTRERLQLSDPLTSNKAETSVEVAVE